MFKLIEKYKYNLLSKNLQNKNKFLSNIMLAFKKFMSIVTIFSNKDIYIFNSSFLELSSKRLIKYD